MFVDPASDTEAGLDRKVFYEGTYEEGTLAIFRGLLRNGDHVLDVGANIGLMTLFAASRVGHSGQDTVSNR